MAPRGWPRSASWPPERASSPGCRHSSGGRSRAPIRVLEEVLPTRFGGAPTDYQLVEDEAADGSPRVALLVHPRVGPVSPEAVARTFLAAIAGGSGAERLMGIVWRDAGLLRVERRLPLATATGKIQHLHVTRPASGTPPEILYQSDAR